ncbi:uncharacterized protein F5147DRAFT_783488 [Suillus discolor]|uniref:Uncharacterized protein n=1 Tax=Suillus discolor TaxID=1912936 RepID=A0A9P7JKY0_9AGAM|nr:uncharacterized protein F5147DRAFT_783488 [Suillus discolor]KAG2081917.1 hypothetical protein F5147DRAFT_783488 [Suillus discolor]
MEQWCGDWDTFLVQKLRRSARPRPPKSVSRFLRLPPSARRETTASATCPLVAEAIHKAEEKCAEDTRKLEEEWWRVEEEEELARKAAEEKDLVRKTVEATALARKIAEDGKKTADVNRDDEQDVGDGEGDSESLEAGEKTGNIIIVKQKTGRMTAGSAPVICRDNPCAKDAHIQCEFSTLAPKGKRARAAAAIATPVLVAGGSRTTGRKATLEHVTVVSEDEDAAPRARPGPRKGKRKAAVVEEEEQDLDEIDDALEREFAIWGVKYQQAEGIMQEMKLEMDRVGVLMAKRRCICK